MTSFNDDRKVWKLVASKGRNAIKDKFSSAAEIDSAISDLNVTF